jgi:hypothetical protein
MTGVPDSCVPTPGILPASGWKVAEQKAQCETLVIAEVNRNQQAHNRSASAIRQVGRHVDLDSSSVTWLRGRQSNDRDPPLTLDRHRLDGATALNIHPMGSRCQAFLLDLRIG